MALPPRSLSILKLLLLLLLVIAASYFLFFPTRYEVQDLYRVTVTGKGKKRYFVENLLENEIDGPFQDSALAALCSSKRWTPGLIINCEAPQGGIGNVRNVFMNCVRYAIEAGATGFIVPEIKVRLTDQHTERLLPFDYLFDQAHFTNTLSAACPRMQLYNHRNDLWDKPSTASPIHLQHPQLTSQFHPQAETVMLSAANWSNTFKQRLNSSHPAKFSESSPVLVSLRHPLLQWPIAYDDPAFISSFGRIFRFREDVRRLAATVIYAMNQKYHLDLDPTAPGIQEGKFYGAYLRTGADAIRARWTPFEIQAQHYISHSAHASLPLMYVAADSAPDILRFTDQAVNNSFPIQVTTKTLLLVDAGFEKELREMEKLTYDQQSLVDYEVLLRASRVGGTWESSFGWNVAMRRHVVMGQGTWLPLMEERPAGNEMEMYSVSASLSHEQADAGKRARRQRVSHFPTSQPQQQAFNDTYSVIFGDVTSDEHPGFVFGLAIWP